MKLTVAVVLLTGASVSAGSGSTAFLRRGSASAGSADTTGRSARSLAITGCPGESDFSVTFNQHCNYENLKNSVYSTRNTGTCTVTADELMINLLGVTSVDAAREKVTGLCKTAYDNTEETFSFSDITKKGTQFDNEYYSGGTYFNYEIQTDDGANELKTDAARVGRIFQDQAQTKVIDLPDYLNSFDPDQDGCDINAAFCCWVQDRQAGDNNGNCNTPYESQCIDKDPGDNTNFCYTDHSRSSTASHVSGGMSIFGDVKNNKENIEGAVHCHGFAWAADETDISSVYKGNNLFFVSLYDHMYQRGYVRNAPGAPMCGCSENMAVVTRADCTEIAAAETFTFDYAAGSFEGVLSQVRDLNFNACQGADGRNNDLYAYYKRLVNEGKQTQANLDTLGQTLVGTEAGKCNEAIVNFLASKGITRPSADSLTADGALGDMIAEDMGVAEIDPVYSYEQSSNTAGMDMPKVPGENPATPESTNQGTGVVVKPLPEVDDEVEAPPLEEEDETVLSEEGEPCEVDENCATGKCLGNQVCGKEIGNGNGNGNKGGKSEWE